jgi:hypothetical protein
LVHEGSLNRCEFQIASQYEHIAKENAKMLATRTDIIQKVLVMKCKRLLKMKEYSKFYAEV